MGPPSGGFEVFQSIRLSPPAIAVSGEPTIPTILPLLPMEPLLLDFQFSD
jgi:hypothetical protein